MCAQTLLQAGFSRRNLLLVAVSGGADSSALAHMLHAMRFNIALASFDHQLRPSSAQDCRFVQQMAEQLGVPFYGGKADIRQLAAQHKLSIEETARQARYKFLFDTAEKMHARAVLSAHTADDQVETVLMHILRGSGTRGLAGMEICATSAFHPDIPLVRPLLGVWRAQIEEYCRQHALQTLVDESNEDQDYFRNRIRHSLIPDLQSYNPAVKQNLLNLAEIVRDDWSFLASQYESLFHEMQQKEGDGSLSFSLERLKTLPAGVQKALVLRGLQMLAPADAQIEHVQVLQVMHFTRQPNQARHLSLSAGLHAFIRDGKLTLSQFKSLPLARRYPQCMQSFNLMLDERKAYPLGDGMQLQVEQLPRAAYQVPVETDGLLWDAYLDLDALQTNILRGRTYQTGDRFQPLGMEGKSIKLSDLFINKKIPVQVREKWLVVENKSAIVWVVGFSPAHFARMQPGTQRLLHLQVKF